MPKGWAEMRGEEVFTNYYTAERASYLEDRP
jgi:hypothetical protein